MVSNQQNLHQVGIDDSLRSLQSLNVNKNEISGEPLKIKYNNCALYGVVKLDDTLLKYEHEKANEKTDIKQKFAH